jgi:hypothetical protein
MRLAQSISLHCTTRYSLSGNAYVDLQAHLLVASSWAGSLRTRRSKRAELVAGLSPAPHRCRLLTGDCRVGRGMTMFRRVGGDAESTRSHSLLLDSTGTGRCRAMSSIACARTACSRCCCAASLTARRFVSYDSIWELTIAVSSDTDSTLLFFTVQQQCSNSAATVQQQ